MHSKFSGKQWLQVWMTLLLGWILSAGGVSNGFLGVPLIVQAQQA